MSETTSRTSPHVRVKPRRSYGIIHWLYTVPSDIWANFTEDLFIYFNDAFNAGLPQWFSYLFCFLLNLSLILCRIWFLNNSNSTTSSTKTFLLSRIFDFNSFFDSHTNFWITLFISGCVLLSLMNSFYLFSLTKKYSIFQSSSDKLVDKDGYLTSPNLKVEDINQSPKSWWTLGFWGDFFFGSDSGLSNLTVADLNDGGRIYVSLNSWDVDSNMFSLCMNIFCFFSPVHVILPLLINDFNSLILVLGLKLLIGLELKYLSTTYQQHLYDSKLLFEQVQHEYNVTHVYPTTQKYLYLKELNKARDKALKRALEKAEYDKIGSMRFRRQFDHDSQENTSAYTIETENEL